MKHLLFAAYIFSVLYCYLQLNTMLDRCIALFKERHPLIPMGEPIGWKGLKLTAELLLISTVPVVNISLGCFCRSLSSDVISEIINNVEDNHWSEIQNAERELAAEVETIEE